MLIWYNVYMATKGRGVMKKKNVFALIFYLLGGLTMGLSLFFLWLPALIFIIIGACVQASDGVKQK